jgi:hypothetical protein
MGDFPPDGLCVEIPDLSDLPEKICLPGGVCLDYVWDKVNSIPSAADMPMNFLGQIGPAMAPLQPFFNILETVLAIFRCVKAIPEALVKLDPSELIKCLPGLAKAVDQILKLIPQLSIPKMVIAILKNLATLIRGVATDLRYLQSQIQRIADMIDRASEWNNFTLNGLLVCAQDNAEKSLDSLAAAMAGLGAIVLATNIFMGLFGGPEIPCFGDLVSEGLSQGFDFVVELLTTLAELLTTIANSIPDPDLVLTLALGEQRC